MSNQQITQEGDRKYFTMIPNIVDDSALDTYEFRLLIHYYRVGNCYEGTKATAKKCRMSMGGVSKKRRSLAAKGWIELQENDPMNPTDTIKITVKDKWRENFESYFTPSPHETPPSPHETPPSPHETKNTKDKNIEIEEEKNLIPLSDFLELWGACFLDKPQPKDSATKLKKSWKTRLKNKDFQENWREALVTANESQHLHNSSWFHAEFFLRNDDNYQKCLNRWMQWRDDQLAEQQQKDNGRDDNNHFTTLWNTEADPYLEGKLAFSDLSDLSQAVLRQMNGDTRNAKESDTPWLRRQFVARCAAV